MQNPADMPYNNIPPLLNNKYSTIAYVEYQNITNCDVCSKPVESA